MKTFTPIGFAEHLMKSAIRIAEGAHVGLEACAKLIQTSAQAEIGYLQPSVGPFPAWEELAESTKADKENKGYVFNSDYNPLLRTGELKASIEYEVSAFEAIIGSKSMIAAYQEFGTSRGIPPRPFMGPAAFKNKDNIVAILGSVLVIGFAGGNVIAKNIGYALGYHQDLTP